MSAPATTVDRRRTAPAPGTEGFTAAEIEEVKILLLVRYLATQTWDSDSLLDRVRAARHSGSRAAGAERN